METFFSDVNLKFLKTSKGDISKNINEDAIKQGVKNCVLIDKDEIPFNNGVKGTRIYNYLFEPLNVNIAYEIRDEIYYSIVNTITRISNVDVVVDLSPTEDAYVIKIYYTPDNSKEPQTVEHILRRIR